MGTFLARAAARRRWTLGMMTSMPSQVEGVAGPGPGVGEVDVDQRRAFSETDPALESTVLVELGIGGKDRF